MVLHYKTRLEKKSKTTASEALSHSPKKSYGNWSSGRDVGVLRPGFPCQVTLTMERISGRIQPGTMEAEDLPLDDFPLYLEKGTYL